jgi:hypothetical protein
MAAQVHRRLGFREETEAWVEVAASFIGPGCAPWRAGQEETARGGCGLDPSSGLALRGRRWGMTGGPHLLATAGEGRGTQTEAGPKVEAGPENRGCEV